MEGFSTVLYLELWIVAFETKCAATAVNIPLQVKFESIFVDKMSSKFRHTPHSNNVFSFSDKLAVRNSVGFKKREENWLDFRNF